MGKGGAEEGVPLETDRKWSNGSATDRGGQNHPEHRNQLCDLMQVTVPSSRLDFTV